MESWRATYLHELDEAKRSRLSGNEGRARVCARRAASLLVTAYLTSQGIQVPTTSAHARLRYLSTLPDLSPVVYEITSHLLMHVDESYSLPAHIDLIEEVQRLAQELSIPEI